MDPAAILARSDLYEAEKKYPHAFCTDIDRKGDVRIMTKLRDNEYRMDTLLHELGHAKSIEVWRENELVGGLYGIDLGHVFCGESMFSRESNTSKMAFIHLVQKLEKENYSLIDCQVYTAHLASLGAREIPQKEFTKLLRT